MDGTGMPIESCLGGKRTQTYFARERLLSCVRTVVITEVTLTEESCWAQSAHVRPFARMNTNVHVQAALVEVCCLADRADVPLHAHVNVHVSTQGTLHGECHTADSAGKWFCACCVDTEVHVQLTPLHKRCLADGACECLLPAVHALVPSKGPGGGLVRASRLCSLVAPCVGR